MENKKVYSKPILESETFVPQVHIAACGDGGVSYLFECNAPAGTLYYYPKSDGNIDGIYTGSGKAERMGSYTPCNIKHQTDSTGDFYDGFVDRNRNEKHDRGEGVIVYRNMEWGIFGPRWNGHATENLDMDSWQVAKS